MNNIFSSNNFAFFKLHFDTYHYTDNRCGSPENYLAYMQKGKAKIVSKQKTIYVNEGDIFVIPYKLPYQSYWYGTPDVIFHSYGFKEIESCESLHFDLQVIPSDPELTELVRSIPIEGTSIHCETLSVFYHALSKLIPVLQSSSPLSKQDEIIFNAQKYISEHTDCSVTDVAGHVFISEPYLYMLFKEKTGDTPNDYRLKVICQKGIEYLITTDKTVEEISSLVGLSSASHFRKILKKHTGLTPHEVRKNNLF